MIKLIASDMDGTLLNNKHTIGEENLKAIKYAQDKGVQFTISTGRDYSAVKPILDEFGIECQCIVMSGAEYRDFDGTIIDKITISNSAVKQIIDIFKEANLSIEMLTNKGLFAGDKEIFEKSIADRKKFFCEGLTDEEIEAFEKNFSLLFRVNFIDDIEKFLQSDIEIYKVMTFDTNTKIIDNVKGKLNKIDELAIASTFSNDIEITDKKAQKGLILAQVIEKMGLERDEVMVLGDSFNDYSMFTEFKHSFAMENAIPEIKEIATYITDSNDNAGVAKAIYKMV